MENTFYLAEKFNRILERVAGEDLFDIEEDGSLKTMVHTGKTIEALGLKVDFPDGSVLVTSRTFLTIEEHNCKRLAALLKSINALEINGVFFIDEDNAISFATKCEFDELIELDNPFEVVFRGCEAFEMFTDSILKALSGTNTFYIRNI